MSNISVIFLTYEFRSSSKSRGFGVTGGAGMMTLRGAGMGVEVPYRTLGTGVGSKRTTGGTITT